MNLRVQLPCLALAAASGFAGSAAQAAEPPPDFDSGKPGKMFGDDGELVVSGATQLSFQHVSPSLGSIAASPATTFLFAPSADYFVLHGFSLGVRVIYQHQSQDRPPNFDSFAGGPRLGYNIRLGKSFSFWPDVYATYGTSWVGGASVGQTVVVGGYAPLLYHPVTHFFAGLGPNVSSSHVLAVQSGGPAVEFAWVGVSATLGGWVDL